ncbi:MAG TPA: UbiA family prenyltransferase [Planctomycetota bacterium]|jgi:4-hydroxybenzoate polyprenyltransferase
MPDEPIPNADATPAESNPPLSRGFSLKAYFRLVRLPNVFTAIADIVAGFGIMCGLYGWQGYANLFILCGASAALYLAGMAFNDVADREIDAEFHADRPIPSGKISVDGAIACGVVLMAIGVGLSALAGMSSLIRGAMLAAAILKYDFDSKNHALSGPLFLGVCRFLNMQLGLSAHPDFGSSLVTAGFLEVPWGPAIASGLYAAGLTAFSAQEEEGKRTTAIIAGWILAFGGILVAGIGSIGGTRLAWAALAPLTLVLLYLTKRLRKLGTPQAARDLVRAGVMGVCVLDCGMVLGFGTLSATKIDWVVLAPIWPFAAICLGLLVPGLIIGKWLRQTEA